MTREVKIHKRLTMTVDIVYERETKLKKESILGGIDALLEMLIDDTERKVESRSHMLTSAKTTISSKVEEIKID